MCFHAQQAAEKSLKAVLLHHAISFRFVHDINELISALDRNGVSVPDKVKAAAELNEYAVEARYPGDYEPVGEKEYHKAIAMAENVVIWAQSKLKVIDRRTGSGFES